MNEIRAKATRTITGGVGERDSCKLCKAIVELGENRFECRTEYSDEPGLARFATVCNECAIGLFMTVGEVTEKLIGEVIEQQRNKVGRRY